MPVRAVRSLSLAVVGITLATRLAAATPIAVVAVGDPSPFGLPFSRFSDVTLDDRGRVAFIGAATAVFHRAGTALVHVIGASDTLAGRVVAEVGVPDVDAGGCVGFRAVFVGGDAGVFRRCGTEVTNVAEAGQGAPGGGEFAAFGPEVALGANGRTAFTGVLTDGTSGLFVADETSGVSEVVRVGWPSPAGGVFTSVRLIGVSAVGRVAFRGTVSGGRDGLFFSDGPMLAKLVVEGDATPVGGSFTAIGLGTVNDDDHWAFRATTSLGPAGGVFRANAAPTTPIITKVALEGDASPVGGTIRLLPTSLIPAINRDGAIAFRAALGDASVTSAVFVATPQGALVKMVGVGEATDVGQLARLREVALGDDGAVLVRASLTRGDAGLFRARNGGVESIALLGDATDLGTGFRFADAHVRGPVEQAVFLGVKEGVFVADGPGQIFPVAVLGEPSALGGTYSALDPPTAAGGRVVFGATIRDGKAPQALFTLARRGAVPMLTTGRRAPGGGRLLDLFADPLDGQPRAAVAGATVAFQAGLTGTPTPSGLFSLRGHRLRAIARAGDTAPGGRLRAFGMPALRSAADVAFVAEVSGPSGTALYRRRGRKTRAIALSGRETATRLGGRFADFDPPAASPDGIVFRATLDQGGRDAIFLARGRSLEALVASGEVAPGGGRFRSVGTPAASAAAFVFHAVVTGGAASGGIYRAVPGEPGAAATLTALVTGGERAPIGGTYLGFGPPSGNDEGAVAFTADLVGAHAASAVFFDRLE